MSITTPHLKWPPELDELDSDEEGGPFYCFADVEQDSVEEIRRAAGLLLEVRPGQLSWDRSLGTPSALASNDPEEAAAIIEAALAQQEPRERFDVVVRDVKDAGVREVHFRLEGTSA